MSRRNSDRLVAIQAIRMARSAVVVLIPTLLLLRVASGAWHTALVVFLVYYVYTRLYGTVAERLLVAYACSSEGFLLRRGRISRTSSEVEWRNVRSITLNAPLLHRLLGCVQVTITPAGAHETPFVLQAVRAREGARIQRIARLHAGTAQTDPAAADPLAAPGRAPASPPSGAEVLTPALRLRDHLLIGVAYGRFVLVVPVVLSAVHAFAQLRGQDLDSLEILRLFASLAPGQVVGIAGAVLLIGILYGTVLSWLRYRNLEVVRRGPDLVFRGGLLDHETRTVALVHVGVVIVRQNVLMRWTGTGQFRCIVGGADGRVSQSMLLPVVPVGRGMRILADSFPDLDATGLARGVRVPRRYAVASVLGAVALLAVVVTGARLAGWPDAGIAAAAAAALVIGVMRVNLASGRAAVDSPRSLVLARSGWLWGRTVICRAAAIESLTLRTSGARRVTGSIRTTLRFRDRFARRVVIRTATEEIPGLLQEAITRRVP